MPSQNDFGAFQPRPVKHNLSLPEHVLTESYLRKTIEALLRTFDEVSYTTAPEKAIEATCHDGRKFRVAVTECAAKPT
jgi:hypothetical protein